MFTPTLSVDGALPVTPLTTIELVTAAPLSGMATSVSLSKYLPADGGVVVPAPTKSSRFAEPAPGLVTLPGVASATSLSRTCAGVSDGDAPSTSAAAPTTAGVAIDVPLIVLVAVLL